MEPADDLAREDHRQQRINQPLPGDVLAVGGGGSRKRGYWVSPCKGEEEMKGRGRKINVVFSSLLTLHLTWKTEYAKGLNRPL